MAEPCKRSEADVLPSSWPQRIVAPQSVEHVRPGMDGVAMKAKRNGSRAFAPGQTDVGETLCRGEALV